MAFNPNEPRDEFGRWTSFGGALSGGDGRRRPRPLRPQDRRVRRENTFHPTREAISRTEFNPSTKAPAKHANKRRPHLVGTF